MKKSFSDFLNDVVTRSYLISVAICIALFC